MPINLSERDFNVLLNPQHRDFSRVELGEPEPLIFDERLG
jgi:RES domain-containing protein